MTIEDVITWLRNVEDLAFNAYTSAARAFQNQPELSSFLQRLGEEEALHYQLLGSAREIVQELDESPVSAILVDAITTERIEGPLRRLQASLEDESPSAGEVIEAMVAAEFSEWNDIFQYVITSCQDYSKAFQYIASIVQKHRDQVVEYVETLPDELRPKSHLRDLPRIRDDTILVVDDDPAVLDMWQGVLSRTARVEIAANGQEALDKTRTTFFDAILTDLDMPVLDGMGFIRQAVEADERLRGRFIICSGNTDQTIDAFARDYSVLLLRKPMRIHQVDEAIKRILEGTH